MKIKVVKLSIIPVAGCSRGAVAGVSPVTGPGVGLTTASAHLMLVTTGAGAGEYPGAGADVLITHRAPAWQH